MRPQAAMLQRAEQALQADSLAAAENTCRQLPGAVPDQRDARLLLSVSLFLQRGLGESLEDNRRLVAEHPDFGEGRLQLANLLETMGPRWMRPRSTKSSSAQRQRRNCVRWHASGYRH